MKQSKKAALPRIRWDMGKSVAAKAVKQAAVQKMPIPSAYYGSVYVMKGDDFDLSFYACIRVSPDSWAIEWSKQTLEDALEHALPAIRSGKGSHGLPQVMKFIEKLGPEARKGMRYVPAGEDDREQTKLDPLPEAYTRLFDAGLLDYRKKRSCIVLDHAEWLTPQDIASVDWPPHVVPGLVPFAQTGSGDHWCWYVPWSGDNEIPVVFSPHDMNRASGFAPNFEGCVYRLVLEQFARSSLLGERSAARLSKTFKRYAAQLQPFLPRRWGATLSTLAARPVRQAGDAFCLMEEDELRAIISRDLTFARMGKKFRQHRTTKAP